MKKDGLPKNLVGRFTLHNILCIEANIMDCEESDRIEKLIRLWIAQNLPKELECDYHDYRKSRVNCGSCREAEIYNIALAQVKSKLLEE